MTSEALPYLMLDPKALMGGRTCCGARGSIQCGLSSLVTNKLVMTVEAKALAKRIAVSAFGGLLALWRVRTQAHWAIVAI